MSKIQSDTTGTGNRIKNDKFLNMTLDFYAGAMMAIDSAKTLKLPIDVAIYDSQETKTTSNVSSLISKLQDADAVVGPFIKIMLKQLLIHLECTTFQLFLHCQKISLIRLRIYINQYLQMML